MKDLGGLLILCLFIFVAVLVIYLISLAPLVTLAIVIPICFLLYYLNNQE